MTTDAPRRSAVERPAPAVDHYVQADIRTAARALLATPLLTRERHESALTLVRRHHRELTTLFADGLGYRLVVEPAQARLFKTAMAPRPLLRRTGRPFDRRRYVLLALTLAALTRARRQLMVDELVAAVRTAAVDAGVELDLDGIEDRRALHSALMALVDLGVLSERDGDLEHWVEGQAPSLVDIHRDRLAMLVTAPLARCDSPDDVHAVAGANAPSSAGGARIAVRRLLVEEPLLTTHDLTEEQQQWWRRNRERERDWFASRFGLELELRAEGALALDPQGRLSDVAFPAPGSTNHVALLLLAGLVDRARPAARGPWASVAAASARSAADEVFASWRTALKKAHREDPDAVYRDALGVLTTMGLVRVGDGEVLVHAAGARYAPRATLAAAPTGEASLFEEDL